MENTGLKLNDCPTQTHFVCGFAFHILWTGKEGIDQHGAKWINVAENENSLIPEPVNPKYLDAYMDAYNHLKQFFT